MAVRFLTAFFLVSVISVFGQAVRGEASALLLRAEKSAVFPPDETPVPYHERVKFTVFWGRSEIKGLFAKDHLSREQWRERYDLGEYVRIAVRNGRQIGEFRSATFEPALLDQLRSSLPPLVIRLDNSDIVKRITTKTVNGVAVKCVKYETVRGQNQVEKEVCVNLLEGTLVQLHQRTTKGFCTLGCALESDWSDYASLRDKLYPRHIVVKLRNTKIIEADVELSQGKDLIPDTFQIPRDFETRRACDQLFPPVQIQGKVPSYPRRIGEFSYEGRVLVQARIGVDGHVQDAQVVHSPAYATQTSPPAWRALRDMDEAVIEAVRAWVFEPAKCDGVPIVQNILIPFKAELR